MIVIELLADDIAEANDPAVATEVTGKCFVNCGDPECSGHCNFYVLDEPQHLKHALATITLMRSFEGCLIIPGKNQSIKKFLEAYFL